MHMSPVRNRVAAGVLRRAAIVGIAAFAAVAASCDVHRIAEVPPLASITVTPTPQTLAVGGSQLFTAVGRDAAGNIMTITPSWTVAAGGGTITSAGGIFTAGGAPGTFANTITATSNGISATATVIVTPGALATITVSPDPQTLAPGATQQYTAVGQDAGGNIVVIAPTWTVVAGGGTINAAGLFTAGATAGTFGGTVRASIGSLAGFATVTVTSGALTSITVTPTPVTLATNGTQQFVAVGKDAGGNAILINPVWSVASGGGTINASTGVFTAGTTAGTFANTVR